MRAHQDLNLDLRYTISGLSIELCARNTRGEIRTRKDLSRQFLRLMRIPVPPLAHGSLLRWELIP